MIYAAHLFVDIFLPLCCFEIGLALLFILFFLPPVPPLCPFSPGCSVGSCFYIRLFIPFYPNLYYPRQVRLPDQVMFLPFHSSPSAYLPSILHHVVMSLPPPIALLSSSSIAPLLTPAVLLFLILPAAFSPTLVALEFTDVLFTKMRDHYFLFNLLPRTLEYFLASAGTRK